MNTARPPRRKSSLAGEHPAYPAPAQEQQAEDATPVEAVPATPETPEKPAKPAATTQKFSTQIDAEVSERARNAAAAAMRQGEHETFAEFVETALLAYTEGLERRWNDGKPFEQRRRRAFPPGRRMA